MHEISLYGTVGSSFWDEEYFTPATVRSALAGLSGPLKVRLNSGGGIASDGQAIYTMLKDYDGEVTVVVDGVAASAASLIAMAGDVIEMRLGSWLLIHDPASMWTEGRGTADDHRELAAMLDKIGDGYAQVYAARTGLSVEEARTIMRAETILLGEEAVEAGFATSFEGSELAAEPAAFDYRIYSNAPAELRRASATRGRAPGKTAVMAMIAGVSTRTKKEAVMAGKPKAPVVALDDDAAAAAAAAAAAEAEAAAAAEAEAQAEADAAAAAEAEKEATAKAKPVLTASHVSRLYQVAARLRVGTDAVAAIVASAKSFDGAIEALTEKVKETGDVDIPMHGAPTARITRDERDKFATGAELAILARAGLGGERNEFTSMSLAEMARASLEVGGHRVRATTKLDVVAQAFAVRMEGGGHSTSDFPAILENVANKAMLRGFEETEESFGQWTSTGSLPDFRKGKRVGVDAFPALAKINEDGEFTYGSFGDFGEEVVLATYGKLFAITRQAIINDDLGAFTRIPQRMGRAAQRTVANLAYGVLTGNPTMGDGKALFHADHGNLAAAGGAPSVTTLTAGMQAMALQKDRSKEATALNIRPTFIIAPVALRGTIDTLLQSEYDPAKTTRAANIVRNAVTPIYDARLDGVSTTAWYLAAAPSAGDTIEVSYLDGNATPFLDSKDGWKTDGVEFKVRIDAAASALAWEGLYKNPGA